MQPLDAKLGAESDRRPGTTLTALCLGTNGALAAHIGDSRIYQVRPGVGIIYRTTDHSLVAEMVARGEMTEEEAMVRTPAGMSSPVPCSQGFQGRLKPLST